MAKLDEPVEPVESVDPAALGPRRRTAGAAGSGRRRQRTRVLASLAIGTAVALVAVLALAMARNSPSSSAHRRFAVPSPTTSDVATGSPAPSSPPAPSTATPSPYDVAMDVSALLDESSAGRSGVRQATAGLADCTLAPVDAESELTDVMRNRSHLLAELRTIPFDLLPDGQRLRTLLARAWTYSLRADRAFLAWARDMEAGDGCGTDASFAQGTRESVRATSVKQQFVTLWNAEVATTLGVPTRTEGEL